MRLRVGSGLPNIQMKEINKFLGVEQNKIANFLSSVDKKIDLVSKIENTSLKKDFSNVCVMTRQSELALEEQLIKQLNALTLVCGY